MRQRRIGFIFALLVESVACAHPPERAQGDALSETCIRGRIGANPDEVSPTGVVKFLPAHGEKTKLIVTQVEHGFFHICLPAGAYAALGYAPDGRSGYVDVLSGNASDVFIYLDRAPLSDERLSACMSNAQGLDPTAPPTAHGCAEAASDSCAIRGRVVGANGESRGYARVGLIFDRARCSTAAAQHDDEVLDTIADVNGAFQLSSMSCAPVFVYAWSDTACVGELVRFDSPRQSRDIRLILKD